MIITGRTYETIADDYRTGTDRRTCGPRNLGETRRADGREHHHLNGYEILIGILIRSGRRSEYF